MNSRSINNRFAIFAGASFSSQVLISQSDEYGERRPINTGRVFDGQIASGEYTMRDLPCQIGASIQARLPRVSDTQGGTTPVLPNCAIS